MPVCTGMTVNQVKHRSATLIDSGTALCYPHKRSNAGRLQALKEKGYFYGDRWNESNRS
jgi:hypothetical protein